MSWKLIYLILSLSIVFGSGGYDNGTATGKGKFQLDITWNPFNKIEFGQTYAVMHYGITDRIDLHGYISSHKSSYYTWYGGLFYQFYKSNRLDLATAIGTRKQFDKNVTHLFLPQLLYTVNINNKLNIGGSFVEVRNHNAEKNYGVAVDVALFYQIKYETKKIEGISIGVGGFHPSTWKSDSYFLPTYSIDIKFK